MLVDDGHTVLYVMVLDSSTQLIRKCSAFFCPYNDLDFFRGCLCKQLCKSGNVQFFCYSTDDINMNFFVGVFKSCRNGAADFCSAGERSILKNLLWQVASCPVACLTSRKMKHFGKHKEALRQLSP